MKRSVITIAAFVTGALIYHLIKKNFGSLNKYLREKAKLDAERIINYKFAGLNR